MADPRWRLWQLLDSAFPTGGFAHSNGLEAAAQLGEVRDAADVERFLEAALWQAGRGAMPLVTAAFDAPERLAELDELCDAFLGGEIANRASRAQGRALRSACARSFGVAPPGEGRGRYDHHAPLLGALARALALTRQEAQRLCLHLAFRGVASAAVRLGLVGPYEAQRLQARFAERLEAIATACAELGEGDLAQPAPLVDVLQGAHDRLYSRLFLS